MTARVCPTFVLWSLGIATMSPAMTSLTSFPSLPHISLKELMRSSSPFLTLKMLFPSEERVPE